MPAALSAPPPSAPPSAPKPAPATKPAAPPPKPPSDKPSPPAAPAESADPFRDAFSQLDEMEAGKKPAPKKEAAKPENPSNADGVENPSATTTTKIGSEDAESASNATKNTTDSSDAKPVKAVELRNAYEGLKKKVKEEYEPQLKELPTLRAKLKEFESRDESQSKATQERIAAVEKRNSELEGHIRFANYEQSKEYQEQFQKPYEDAWGTALRELKGLTMKIEDPKTGEESVREVTQADIAYFANLDPAARRTEINRLFPEDKEEVKRHINQISHLAEKSEQARQKAKADAETHAKTQTEQQQQSQQTRARLWEESNKTLATKYPQWFAKSEDDVEGNGLLEKGQALADLMFDPQSLTPDRIELLPKAFKEQIASGKPFSQQQLVSLNAIIRNKAANHDRLLHNRKALEAQIAELEKSLKEYEKSSPDGVVAGDGTRPTNGVVDPMAELETMDRRHS